MRWLGSLTLAAQRCTSWWLRTNSLTFLLFLLSRELSTFNHILCNHNRAFLTCYLDDPTHLHGISYSVTSYKLDKFFLLTLQFHPALVAGTGAWTLPFNAAMSKHLYTSYPPYILWLLLLSRKTFQTWTCSPAQVLIRYLLLSSSTQRKQFRMIVVRDTLKTFCFPFLLLARRTRWHSICSCQTVSPHIFGTNFGSAQERSNYIFPKVFVRLQLMAVSTDLFLCWRTGLLLNIKHQTHSLVSAQQGTPTNPSIFFATFLRLQKNKMKVYTTFLDLFAAYNSVPREKLC